MTHAPTSRSCLSYPEARSLAGQERAVALHALEGTLRSWLEGWLKERAPRRRALLRGRQQRLVHEADRLRRFFTR